VAYVYKGKNAPREAPKGERRRGPGRNPRHGNGCGTPAGYATHRRHNTPVCLPCKAARSEYRRNLDRAKRQETAA